MRIIIALLILNTITFGQNEKIVSMAVNSYPKTVQAGQQFTVDLDLTINPKWHINSNKPNDEFLIPSVVSAKTQKLKLVKIIYPKAHEIKLSFSEAPVSVYEGNTKIGLTFLALQNAVIGKETVEVIFDYQACNDVSCLPPTSVTTSFTVVLENAKDIKQSANVSVDSSMLKTDEVTLEEIKQQNLSGENQTLKVEKKDEGSVASTLEKSGLFLSLIFIFLAGLALNLTPCVYPLIPITIGYFGGQAEGKTSRLLLLGILYMLGMAITYSVIGVITSLSGAVFGTLLQNPIVIIGIVLLFIALALSQFGVYEFKLPDSLVAKAGGAKGGAFGAFFMGLTMGIVAAPCIGPFVLGLVTYVAAKGDPYFGFLMFFVLAIGLGFPYLLLAVFSGKIKSLPRSGVWMEGVKHIFGFLLLGMAFYFIDPILPKSIQGYLLPIFGIIAAVILLFVDKTANNVKVFRSFKTIFSLVVLVVSVYALLPKQKLEPEWQKFSIQAYETSLKNNERMVIDFYADWCIPCKELDALTFSDKQVISLMESFSNYKVDMTKTTDENEALRKKFNVVGMPTVLIIDSNGNETNRITGFVDAREFLSFLKDVK
ncbi:MAG: protein-disulfide reductase DsbD [Ignavibacteriaceae bacterium]|nr:protein-disulfide reductase DsbD [Ignavibacteriaceae bacterium]